MRRLPALLFLVFSLVLPALCGAAPALAPFSAADVPAEPDYAKVESWLIKPEAPGQYPVDVFWVYPTILADKQHWLMDISSQELQKRAATTLAKQASVFNGQANIYAPLYRQMNMAALSLPESEQNVIMHYGKADVWRALQYYLTYENNGRPFILAGHSQGSNILVDLLRTHWGKTGAEDRLIAVYAIGWSVTPDDLAANPHLAICESATQTACIITYNTVAAGRQCVAPTILEGTYVVNPLTWKTDSEFAPASQNLGARFLSPDGKGPIITQFTSAQIVDNGLVVAPKNPALVHTEFKAFPAGVYHQFDYALFYENLRQNAATRIRAFDGTSPPTP